MKKKRNILILTTTVLIILSGYLLFLRHSSAIEVNISDVVQGDLTSTISSPGIIRPLTEVQISSSVTGTVQQLPVKEGQEVNKGDLLLQIDPTEFRAQVRRAQAGLEVAQANQVQTRSRLNRARQLYNSKLISEQEYEDARTNHLLSQAQVKEAKANLEQSLDQLQKTRITSPIQGTIIQVNIELGENVITGNLNVPGTRLMIVADLSRMKAQSQVDEADIAKVNLGQKAVIEVEALPGKKIEGKVHEIGYAAENQESDQKAVVRYNISILIERFVSDLKPGMTATSEIITEELKNILMVPIQSVVTRPANQLASEIRNGNGVDLKSKEQSEAVFIMINGTAQLVPVTVGVAGQEYIQIKSGLEPGQKVITGPFNVLRELRSGERVKSE